MDDNHPKWPPITTKWPPIKTKWPTTNHNHRRGKQNGRQPITTKNHIVGVAYIKEGRGSGRGLFSLVKKKVEGPYILYYTTVAITVLQRQCLGI